MVFKAKAQNALISGSLLAKRILGGTHQVVKQLVTLQSKNRELLAIYFNPSFMKTVDQAAIAQAVLSSLRIDPGYPERAEVTLFLLTVAVRVGETFFQRAARLLIELAATDKAGSQLQLPFMSAATFWSAFGTRHRKSTLPLMALKVSTMLLQRYGKSA
jgi:hypothetical protein